MSLNPEIGLLKKAIARIRHANGSVVGAGFLITDSCLLTCAHVVTEALGILQMTSESPTALVELDFPFASNADSAPLKAQVIFWSPVNPGRRGEDIAGLKLEGAIPEGIQPLSLLRATAWWKHPFGAFGFPQGHDSGIWASGELLDQRGDDGWVQIEAIKAQGYPVLPGFSGSPVWDEKNGGIVGMTVAAEKKRAEAQIAFLIPTEILANAIEALSLIELLSPYYSTIESKVRQAFNACCPKGWPCPMPETLATIVAELQDMPPGDAQISRILQFAARLAMAVPNINQQLQDWAISQGHNWQALLGQIQSAPTISQMSYLAIMIQDTNPRSDRYFVKAWFVSSSATGWDWSNRKKLNLPEGYTENDTFRFELDEDDHKKEMSRLLQAFLSQQEEPLDLTIEIFLPRKLLSHPVDTWETEMYDTLQPIGHEHKVIVRSIERVDRTYIPCRRNWKQKWETLQQATGQQLLQGTVAVDDCKDSNELLIKLQLPTTKVFQLTQLPANITFEKAFGALLRAGIPVGLWLRRNLTQCNGRSELDRILECCVIELLEEQVRQERSNSYTCDPDAHIGHHLSLLREDPNRLPEIFQYEMS
ncbi:trypsin-like peptidase domain-containing protein [Rivularia sp. UHCC 0363]|uniref:VMAP-C domain-containing protein n=1 Tax=Rivularia sp. UHCC 0363 TaxID=3110244 RepID=UPI002B1F1172|nr:trypsin-like peptidase domain-containing protein [Rivularia sp. UHCC 0363]MEA5597384.1 trypsin-like peptidase domain-containing protein [Rivularia sp. UHCC 0363]